LPQRIKHQDSKQTIQKKLMISRNFLNNLNSKKT
jgi:hypothetical protein